MRPPLLLLAVAAATLIGACSSAGTPSTPTPTLDGRTFLSTDVQGMTLVPGTRITLTFKDGTSLGASGGCNSMGGTYTIAGDRLTTSQMFMTEMACDEPRMKQDEWLAKFLSDVKIALTGDTLTMDDGTVRVTFLDQKVATPDQPIEGTLWVVDGIVTGEAVSSIQAAVTASIRIADGRVEVDTGCNTGGGTVQVAVDTLTFGPIALTKRACGPEGAAMEEAVNVVLQGTVPYSIDADALTLDGGANGLILRATR